MLGDLFFGCMVRRSISKKLEEALFKGKAVIIFGARQCGKTTLSQHLLSNLGKEAVWLSGDDDADTALFSSIGKSLWMQIMGNHRIVVIDEAQKIPDIGRAVKILVDSFPGIQAILTGSSSFQIAKTTEEALTGRKYEYEIFPLSFMELCDHHGFAEEHRQLGQRLVFGSYPEIVVKPEDALAHIQLIAESYLYKDLFQYEGIRKPQLLKDLLKALAWQIGSEVSSSELAGLLGASRSSIDSYISLLEQAFIIFSLRSFSSNKRNELKKSRKIYFYDTGIRNAVIGDFTPLNARKDVGALWENYLIAERQKLISYRKAYPSHVELLPRSWFWRTSDGAEVDYIEETAQSISAFEFKWKPGKPGRITRAFTNRYPSARCLTVSPENYYEFLKS